MNSKLILRILLNTGIGVVLIYFWLKLVDLEATVKVLKEVNPLIIIPCIALFVLLTVFRSLRLHIFLAPQKATLKDVLNLNFLSQLLSFLIPIRAGEITKGVYLSTQYKIPLSRGVALIFLDRFFDFWLVVFLSLILLILIPNTLPQTLVQGLIFILFLFTLATILLILIPEKLKKILLSLKKLLIFSFVKKIYTQLVEFVIDIGVLLQNNLPKMGLILFYTIASTISEAFVWYILLSSLGLSINYFSALLGSMLNALTFLIPAAPGYVGSAEAAGLAVFNLGLGFDKTAVAAATLLYHAFVLIFMLIFGLLGLYLLKFDLKLVWEKLRKRN